MARDSAAFDKVRDAARRHSVPAYVSQVVRDGEVIHAGAVGARDAGTGAPMTQDTVFRIYSMTKAVTTAAAMQLVERGQIDLDAPAGRYVSELADVQVLTGFDAAGAPQLRPPKQAPTVRQLLLHTSGFGYTLWSRDLSRYFAWMMSQGAKLNPSLDLPLVFDPGEMWEYGVGVDWAGKVIENASGLGLDCYFAANIFEPLGMADTGFAPTPSMSERLADSYMRGEDGALARAPRMPAAAPDFLSGGGGLLSTAPDYAKFLAAIAGDGSAGGARILRPETVAQMAACGGDAPKLRRLATAFPALTNDLDLWGEAEPRWSLGFMVNPEPGPHGRPPGSLAWAGLSNTYYWIDRENRLAGVLMTQIAPFADPDALAVFAALEQAAYASIGE